ncbi:8-amino-7-oxononanoate synthase [Paractinoplanes atraurantiacus]|uniref:8-amino-7-oxononanoate synthase n=1 Tax=Paractinoplanes atraurantiacus TaxID=1036182 RepID=A0A285IPQ0_9ACTN|nr:8-amino-7-oxononanoate synthase [Actinoplanes atraurantiacus]SNY49687.1 8-amino-7-oxononanoate synthase [Actinoplanes atraurantiacus]
MSGWLEELDRLAASRAKAGLTRQLRPRATAVDLAGNDYLGLAGDPRVTEAAAGALARWGLGATGSRLVRGTTSAHASLEASLGEWLGTAAALVFSSGYLANLAAVRSMAALCDVIVSDAYNHASLIDGCRMAGTKTIVAPHNSPSAVAAILDAQAPSTAVVVTESVFSVDGDLAPLAELHEVTSSRGALLLVDDAHALGLLGPEGAGGVAAAGLAGKPDVVVTATLSKSLGGAGGVVAGPAQFIKHLIDTGRTFIYDTALPPAVAAGVEESLRIARAADDRRALVAGRAAQAVARLRSAGFEVASPAAGVLSVVAPGPEAALAWAADCRDRGIAVGCFRPPSTPDGSSRLRLTLNAGVTGPDFARALDVIVECAP